jgi:hypothetical protein
MIFRIYKTYPANPVNLLYNMDALQRRSSSMCWT